MAGPSKNNCPICLMNAAATLRDSQPRMANGSAIRCEEFVRNNRIPGPLHNGEDNTTPWICHIDFLPKCLNDSEEAVDAIFETFDLLINRADAWLQQNTKFELVNCETIDKKVCLVENIYMNSLLFNDDEVDDSPDQMVHIKGLRLWYRKSSNPSLNASLNKLLYKDFIPKYLNPGDKHPVFETLTLLTERINQQLREKPLNGHIINIETVCLKIAPADWSSNCWLLSRRTKWYDEYNTHKLSFLRMYYRNSYPCHQSIGMIDFVPDVIDEGGIFHPAKYTYFTTLLQKSTNWITQSADGITVLNIQTLNTKHRKKSETKSGKRFTTEELFEKEIESRFRAFFIRVSYKEEVSPQVTINRKCDGLNIYEENGHLPTTSMPRVSGLVYRRPRLTCKSYIPIKHCYGYEDLTQLVERAESELRSLHANIYHIETVAMPEWTTNPDICERGERTYYDGEWYFLPDQDGNELGPFRYRLLYIIRVYFDCPPLHKALQRRMSMYSVPNNCCVIL